jgi:hypothetical protein
MFDLECENMWKHVPGQPLHLHQISAWSDFKYGRKVAILENQLSPITTELMARYSPNFYHSYI